MIPFQQARQIATEEIGPDCDLVDDRTIERPYGWYFMYQSKEFLRTGDRRRRLIGSGRFIVSKQDGRVCTFASSFSDEYGFSISEYGLGYQSHDLTIISINDIERTIDLLSKLQLRFVVPEFAHGRRWRIPQLYTRTLLAENLSALPCTFEDCKGFKFRYGVFLEIDAAACFEYKLREHVASTLTDRSDSP